MNLPIARRFQGAAQKLGRIRGNQRDSRDRYHAPCKCPGDNVRQVEICAEESDAPEINHGGPDEREDHDRMPGGDLERHHDEFVDDQNGEADGYHPRTLDGDEDLREALDDTPLVRRDEDPDEEGPVAQGLAAGELFVQLGIHVRQLFVHIPIEHQREDGSHGVDGRVANQEPVPIQGMRLELGGDAEHGLTDADDEAAMDDELRQLGGPLVAVAAVPDEQFS